MATVWGIHCKDERLKTREEVNLTTQVGDHQNSGSGGKEKWSDSGYIVKAELTEFAEAVEYEMTKKSRSHGRLQGF